MSNIKPVIQYIIILSVLSILAITAILVAVQINPATAVGIYGYIFIPAISAVIARSLTGERLKKGALKLGSIKNIALAWTIGVGMALLAFFIPILLKLGATDPAYSKFTELISQVGATVPENPPQFFAFMSIMSLTLFLVPATLIAFGEEFGFRGYLLPKLLKFGKHKAIFFSGLIWGIWRIPLFSLTDGLSISNTLSLLLTAVLFGSILAWLYFRSESIWIPSIAGAAYQSSQALYVLITDIKPWIIEFSGIIILSIAVVILYFSREFEKIPEKE